MDSNKIFQVVLVLLILKWNSVRSLTVDVMDYGAVGDGVTDDSQAFEKTWEAACGSSSGSAVFNVPKGKKFLLNPTKFQGPCKSPNLNFMMEGEIIAPNDISYWRSHYVPTWLTFEQVNGLVVNGNGLFDGQGAVWWKLVPDPCQRPTALGFSSCNNLELSGLTHINSPRNHISINLCTNVTVASLHITAPETSHNTDGIDIASSVNVQIHDCDIGTGDDCIAINSGCKYINITGVNCGPGHGISVGSLGMEGSVAEVEEIHVQHCTFSGTQNGARIKTWPGGSGFARNIVFQDITLVDAFNPIFIDQYYCFPGQPCQNQTSAVKVSDIWFNGFRGTSMSEAAVNLDCSKTVGCTQILLDHINITAGAQGMVVGSSCTNAYGRDSGSIPPVDCLLP
ncbi:putative polygalacturonase [Hibiscus syriacus]|uniref:endo-polygalacturonase n=1 Tax=Hibiscus syriacus TaxID=106335 RepID=A0A6A3A4X6_HIBSY|nr:putative polygalacturonase [Hibiscus syriacus]